MLTLLIKYILLAIISTAFFYLIGGIVSAFLKTTSKNIYEKTFFNLLLGIFSTVLVYSILTTHFNTVFLGLLIPAFFFLSKNNVDKLTFREAIYIDIKNITISIFLISASCIFSFYFLYDHSSGFIITPEADKVFYVRIAEYMNLTGIESNYLDYFNNNSPAPYHFFEIWVNAFLSKVSGLNTTLIQTLCTNAIFFTTLFYGTLSLISHFKKVVLLDIILCIVFPFFTGIKLPFDNPFLIHEVDFFFFFNPILHQKLYVVYFIFLSSALLFLNNKKEKALLVLLIGSFVNISLLATIPITVVVLCFIAKTENKLKIIIATLSTAAFTGIFYVVNNSTNHMVNAPSLTFLLKENLTTLSNLKIVFNNSIKTITESILIYLPFIILLIFLIKSRLSNISVFSLSMTLSFFLFSTIAWSIFNQKIDSVQLFDNIGIPAINILFFIVFITTISKLKPKFNYLAYGLFFVWGAICIANTTKEINIGKQGNINSYSQKYISAVSEKISTKGNQGGYLTNFNGYHGFHEIQFTTYTYRNYLAYVKSNINVTLLEETNDIALSTDSIYRLQQETTLKKLYFNRFVESQKQQKTYINESQSRIYFIKKYNLEFIFAEKDVVPDSALQNLIDTIIVDSISGEQFILLKKQ